MTNTMRRRLAILGAVAGLLALTTACASAPARRAGPTGPTGGTASHARTQGRVVTADTLDAYRKVADCLRQQGVKVVDPKAGQPWDDTPMSTLFGTDRAKWDTALSACPDYKRVVVGVG
jgi:hypothetical protein